LQRKMRPFFEPKSYKVAHGGRGSAKSWTVARMLLIMAAQKPLRVLCAREVQKSIKDSVHRLLSDQIQKLGLGWFYDILETEIRGKNGSLFVFAGIAQHTVESLKSFEGVNICWVEEAQVVTKKSWDTLSPTIRTDNSEIWVTLNPDLETDETYQRFVANPPLDSIVVQMNWRDNPWFTDRLEAERQETLRRDPENYDNIWEGLPKRVSEGAIYKEEVERLYTENRATNVPYDPTMPVNLVFDLGWNDAMCIAFVQRSNTDVRVIDYIEDSHKTLDHYVAEIEKRPFRFGTYYLPHDGRQRDFKSGKSTEEILKSMGKTVEVLDVLSIEEGIRLARMMFPKTYIDVTKCGRLLECLKRYKRMINQRTGEPDAPLHDEFSHGADTFRYTGMAVSLMRNSYTMPKLPITYRPTA